MRSVAVVPLATEPIPRVPASASHARSGFWSPRAYGEVESQMVTAKKVSWLPKAENARVRHMTKKVRKPFGGRSYFWLLIRADIECRIPSVDCESRSALAKDGKGDTQPLLALHS